MRLLEFQSVLLHSVLQLNKNPNRFYVYLHRRLTDGSVFYVGKGSNQRAWDFSCSSRNPYWHNTYNKYGIIVEILYDNLSEQQALDLEVDTIFVLKQFNQKLCNLTSGGEGVSGGFYSDQQRLVLSERQRGRTPWNLGLVFSDKKESSLCPSRREQLSLARKGKYTGLDNSFADLNIYWFIRLSDGLEVHSTRSELVKDYSANRILLNKLFGNNPRKSADGWKLKKDINDE